MSQLIPPPPTSLPSSLPKRNKSTTTSTTPPSQPPPSYQPIVDPYLSSFHATPPTRLKILLITQPSLPSLSATILQQAITSSQQQDDNETPHLIITPEHWCSRYYSRDNPHPEYTAMAHLFAQYHCYGVIGCTERNGSLYHNACVVFNPRGQILGTYRKRHLTPNERCTPGHEPGLFDTIYGRMAVMICFDMENEGLRREVLSYGPMLIINPTFISGCGVDDGDGDPTLKLYQIKTSMEAMSRNLEHICREHHVHIIRCDNTIGMGGRGTHQLITPYSTIYPPTSESNHDFSFYLDTTGNDFSKKTREPERDRSNQEDRVGSRYLMNCNNVVVTRQTGWFHGMSGKRMMQFVGHNRLVCSDGSGLSLVNADVLHVSSDGMKRAVDDVMVAGREVWVVWRNVVSKYGIVEKGGVNGPFQLEGEWKWMEREDVASVKWMHHQRDGSDVYLQYTLVMGGEGHVRKISLNDPTGHSVGCNVSIGKCQSMQITANGNILAIKDHTLQLLDATTGLVIQSIPLDPLMMDTETLLIPSLQSNCIFITSNQRHIQPCIIQQDHSITLQPVVELPFTCVLAVNSGKCFVTTNDGELIVYDLMLREVRHVFHPVQGNGAIRDMFYDVANSRLMVVRGNVTTMIRFISNRFVVKDLPTFFLD